MSELNREKWLTLMAQQIERKLFRPLGLHLPKYRVSCSWPGGGSPRTRIGECWGNLSSEDGTYEMFISPELDEPMRVSDVLAHEMVHAAVGLKCGHKGPFVKVARAIGLQGKPTETTAGPDFIEAVEPILAKMPPYPHATLRPTQKKKKETQRLLKMTCPNDADCYAAGDLKVYTSAKQLEKYGTDFLKCPVCDSILDAVK